MAESVKILTIKLLILIGDKKPDREVMKSIKRNFQHLFWGPILLGLLTACVGNTPLSDSNDGKAQCDQGQTFSTTLRRCIASVDYATNKRPAIGANQEIGDGVTTSLVYESQTVVTLTLSTATDEDSDKLQYIPVTLPSQGTLTNCMNLTGSDGSDDTTCTYTKTDAEYAGVDQFTYRVFDGKEYSPTNANVTLTFTAQDDAVTLDTLSDHAGTEDNPVFISAFKIDEGGGVDEDTQEVKIKVTSTGNVITNANIDVLYGTSTVLGTGGLDLPVNDGANSADLKSIYLILYPTTNATGTDTITVSVTTDTSLTPTYTVTDTFDVTITGVDDAPTFDTSLALITPTATSPLVVIPLTEDDSATHVYSYTVNEGGGTDEDTQSVSVTVTASNTTLTPLANIEMYYNGVSIGNAGAGTLNLNGASGFDDTTTGTETLVASSSNPPTGKGLFVNVDPPNNEFGTSDITVTINDGTTNAATTFQVDVAAVDDDPVLSNGLIDFSGADPDLTTAEDTAITTASTTFTVSEGNSQESSQGMSLRVSSSDTTVIPNANIEIYYDGTLVGTGDTTAWVSLGRFYC